MTNKKKTYQILILASFISSALLSILLFGFWKGVGVILLLVIFGWAMNLENSIRDL